MICESCHSEWTTSDGKIYIFCPFCQNPIVPIQEEFKTMEDALCYLTRQYTPEILEDKQTILQFIDTFLPTKRRERNFLNIAYTSGLVKAVLSRKNNTIEQQQAFLQQSIEELKNVYGISEEWANYIMSSIASSLGVPFQSRNSSVQKQIDAENGDIHAQLSLAIDFLNHEEIENYLHWIRVAIENGSIEAEFHYGKYLCQKNNDRDKGIQYLMDAAEKDNMDAICYMARNITSLSALNQNKIANCVGKIGSDDDLLSVQQLIDLSYYFEDQNNLDPAISMLEKAYAKDPSVSWSRYVEVLEKRSKSMDLITIGKVYRQVAETGNISAIKALAAYVENKSSSAADIKTALYWYKIAADAGDLSSQLRLAKAYETGEQTKQDLKKATEWYEIAAANGSSEAYQKISFKSPHCIRKTVSLILEDDSIIECNVRGFLSEQGSDYLIVADPDTNESLPLLYRETGSDGDFEVEPLEEEQEDAILQAFRRKNDGCRI